jgi:hypothetical protein
MQMVCSVSTRFVGTFGSTFSGFVHRLRGHHHPSLVPDKVKTVEEHVPADVHNLVLLQAAHG